MTVTDPRSRPTVDDDPRQPGPTGSRIPARNRYLFALVAFVCLVGAVLAVRSSGSPRTEPDPDGITGAPAPPDQLAAVRVQPHLTFRSTALGPDYGSVARVPLGPSPSGPDAAAEEPAPVISGLQCERVAEAADRGICLVADRGALTTYRALVFDQDDQVLFTADLPGSPSRTRVSADGRFGSVTVFVTGHAYSDAAFSTFTEILDLHTGASFGDLEQFATSRDGRPLDAIDRNFWGVTFAADPTTFYATVSSGGTTSLVRGDLTARTMTALLDGVECPSLSPDGTRIAFKQRRTEALGRIEWGLAVLDLDTMAVHPLAEARSVDDQPEWLDDRTVLYGMAEDDQASPTTDVWAVPADGTGSPQRFRAGAWSPSVDRSSAPAG